MGFWTDKDKQENQNTEGQNFQQDSQFFSKQFSTFRQCKNDPNDKNFLLCKNITQEYKDGQFETKESEEERIPADQFYNNMPNPFQGVSPFFGIMDSLLNNTFNSIKHDFESLENNMQQQKDDSFFGRIKSLFKDDTFQKDIQNYYKSFQSNLQKDSDNNQLENNPQQVFKQIFSRSSSSRSCKQDREDEQFLICTTTTKKNIDGQESTEVNEERVPKRQNFNQNNVEDMFKEINVPGLFFQTPQFMPFPNMGPNVDPFASNSNFNNDNNYQSNQQRQNDNFSRNSRQNSDSNYKYPQYEEKKPRQQSGIYDL
ncbi:hypothetical protein ABPG72_002079 [Tetrahymena utriculariae]